MKRSSIVLALGALITIGTLVSLPGCGHSQKLVGITVQPSSFTFLTPDPAGAEQYTAIGTYIHPPATKDITNQVTWKVDDNVVNIHAGLVSPDPTLGCGGGTISASLPNGSGGSSAVGYATITVDDPSNLLCPGGGKLATLSVGVVGGGTVTSLPGGISCPGTCIAVYDTNSSVLLTANGPTVTWANCPQASANQCVVTIPSGGAAVIATFQ